MTRRWRDVLPIHPAAQLFPRMTPDELKALGEDMKKNGQRQPIAIIEKPRRRPDGTLHVKDPPLQEVLDGMSRLDSMEAVGINVIGKDGQLDCRIQRIVIDTDETDPVAYVISANIRRRHLTAEQKRDLIAKLLKATPEKSDRQIAETVKASPTTVGTVRAEMKSTVQSGQLPEKRVGKDGRSRKQPASRPHKAEQAKSGAKVSAKETPTPAPSARDDTGPESGSEVEELRRRLTDAKEISALIGQAVARLRNWSTADQRRRDKVIQILEHVGGLIEQLARDSESLPPATPGGPEAAGFGEGRTSGSAA